MQIPVISGIVADESGAFLNSYPTNREPILKDTGLSNGYLAAPPGITTRSTTGLGQDRGGINWNGVCYRVIGTKLVRVGNDWSVIAIGDVGGGGPCAFDYSFDNLIINSGALLYYWNNTDGLRQVTDPDLGPVLDAIYVDGYTMTTDGASLVVTELNDPMAVMPLKYGSSEDSPDPVTGLVHMHGEVYALNRYTVQVFQNIGGLGFPFQTVKTATVPYGCVGPRAKCKFNGTVAFVGSQENGQPGVYLLGAGDAAKLSTQEVDSDLAALSESELAAVWVESRNVNDDQRLIVHLPSVSWGFSTQVTRKSSVKTWCRYVSSTTFDGRYEGRGLVYCYGQWIVGNSAGQVGSLDWNNARHFDNDVMWQFDTALLYNDSNRAIVTGLELFGTPGRGDDDGRVFWSYTRDGETWSMERATPSGKLGQRNKRIAWRPGTRFNQYMGLRFRGCDGSLMGIARLEADIEPLNA
jgi:Phage stabilisation protein